MTIRMARTLKLGLVVVGLLAVGSCGGAGGGPGPSGAGQGLVLMSFLEDGIDNVPLNCRLSFTFSEPVDASTIGWPDRAEVIGVSHGGEAKAYPVSFLSGRELVIDEVDNIPILVSW